MEAAGNQRDENNENEFTFFEVFYMYLYNAHNFILFETEQTDLLKIK